MGETGREKFKDELKESLNIEQIYELVVELGGNPRPPGNKDYFVSQTICHNYPNEGSYKLYYYDNTKLFKCFTNCESSFDIFQLVMKVKKREDKNYSLPQAINFVSSFFGIKRVDYDFFEEEVISADWQLIYKLTQPKEIKQRQVVELKSYNDSILNFLPRPRILPWEQEGITPEVMQNKNICFNPVTQSIVIPHYDMDNNLIGIRERTLVKENETYGKYRPAILGNKMYNHPLSFALYNLNNSKDNIKNFRKVIVFEGEKSSLKYASLFGEEADITVAACGSSLIGYQVKLLLSLGVEEIIIGFDKQFKELGDDEWKRWTQKLEEINHKYSNLCQISFLFDKNNLLNYKDSPIDQGIEVFLELFKERVRL